MGVDFIKIRLLFYGLSGFLMIGTLVLLISRGGPKLGIDFTGGISVQFSAGTAAIEEVRAALAKEDIGGDVQSLGVPGEYMARFKKEEEERGLDAKLDNVLAALDPSGNAKVLSKDFVGAVVGQKLRDQAIMAIALSFLGIIVYVGFRFKNLIWGVAGVLAIIHDVWVTIGFITLLGYEIDLVVVASLLTLAGFSINDTVVIFDRLRERMRVYVREPLYDAINKALNDTMSRTLLTAGLVFMSTLALVLLGGQTLRPFSVALLFGVVVGSYSTIGVASNLVYTWATLTGLKGR